MPIDPEAQAISNEIGAASFVDPYANYPGVFHGFFGMTSQMPRARQAVEKACTALRAAFDAR